LGISRFHWNGCDDGASGIENGARERSTIALGEDSEI
jgi:hypothetical protein